MEHPLRPVKTLPLNAIRRSDERSRRHVPPDQDPDVLGVGLLRRVLQVNAASALGVALPLIGVAAVAVVAIVVIDRVLVFVWGRETRTVAQRFAPHRKRVAGVIFLAMLAASFAGHR